MKQKNCIECKKLFEYKRDTKKFCCVDCRFKHNNRKNRNKPYRKSKPIDVRCKSCGVIGKFGRNQFCGDDCRIYFTKKRIKQYDYERNNADRCEVCRKRVDEMYCVVDKICTPCYNGKVMKDTFEQELEKRYYERKEALGDRMGMNKETYEFIVNQTKSKTVDK